MVLEMSDKEIQRGQLIGRLIDGEISQLEASKRLGVSVRQVKRLKRCYLAQGIVGIISKKRGKPSNRRISQAIIDDARSLIGRYYADFGPTLAAQKLREQHQIVLSVERVRQEMIAAGYWKPKRGQAIQAHPLRQRRSRLGELIQIDGSPHDWFESRSPKCCLLVFIDDATSQLMELRFVQSETTLNYMAALESYIHRHGLPMALYSDRHSIFRVNAASADHQAQTQFGRAIEALGIEGIQARSAQAKGRVERANQTLQDRLIKEMRLQKIDTPDQANAWLPCYIADHNRRFAVKAAEPEDAHVRYTGESANVNLRRILSVQDKRTLSKNLSCQHEGYLYQAQTQGAGLALRGAQVMVHSHHDGAIELLWRGRALTFTRLIRPTKQQAPADAKQLNGRVDKAIKKRSTWKPKSDHPWKQLGPPIACETTQDDLSTVTTT
jgi:Helix-turn-helix domain